MDPAYNVLKQDILDLEARVSQDEYRIRQVMSCLDFDTHPFTLHMLEANATEAQVEATYDLMDDARQLIQKGTPMRHHAFEQAVYRIFPSLSGHYGFAEGIVSTLNRSGQHGEVFDYYVKNGMNLH